MCTVSLIDHTECALLSCAQVIEMQNGDYGCVHDVNKLSDEHWRHYNLVMVMLQYVLPLTAVTFTYGHMAKVRKRKRERNLTQP